jgi:hypothetical protein
MASYLQLKDPSDCAPCYFHERGELSTSLCLAWGHYGFFVAGGSVGVDDRGFAQHRPEREIPSQDRLTRINMVAGRSQQSA